MGILITIAGLILMIGAIVYSEVLTRRQKDPLIALILMWIGIGIIWIGQVI